MKSFDKKIALKEDTTEIVIDRDHKTGAVVIGDDVETYSYLGTYTTDSFEEMREKWKELTAAHMIPLEYVKDEWVWVLASPHPDPADRRYTQVIKHKGGPLLRPARTRKKDKDLKFRPAEPRDYGYADEDQGKTIVPIEELLKQKPWIDRWFYRYSYLAHHFSDCICGCTDVATARELFIEAFVLIVADAHMALEEQLPERAYHLQLMSVSEDQGIPRPLIRQLGTTPIDPSTEQYKYYVRPTLEGRAWVLAPDATFYAWDNQTQLTELYYEIVGIFGKYYRIP